MQHTNLEHLSLSRTLDIGRQIQTLYSGMHLHTKWCDSFNRQKSAETDSLLVHAKLPRFRIEVHAPLWAGIG